MSDKKFYKGLYLISILADRELPDVSSPEMMIQMLGETIDGAFVGSLEMHDVAELTPAAMEQELWRSGSEPGFFDLPDLVEEVEGLVDEALTSDCGVGDEYVQVSKRALNQLMEAVGSTKRLS